MNIKEALLATVDGLPFSDAAITKALIDNGLNPPDAYSASFSNQVDLAAIDLLYAAYTMPDVSEGGFSISHPDFLRKIEARLLQLARKHNVSEVLNQFEPTIKVVNPW